MLHNRNQQSDFWDSPVSIIPGARKFFEAAWMHKYNGKYYLSYSGKGKLSVKGKILYGIGDSPYGAFEYKGVILGKVNSGTNHASIADYKGQWFLFYHNSDLFFKKIPSPERSERKSGIESPFARTI